VPRHYGLPVAGIATLADIVAYLQVKPEMAGNLQAVLRYREQYGISGE